MSQSAQYRNWNMRLKVACLSLFCYCQPTWLLQVKPSGLETGNCYHSVIFAE